MAKGRVFSPLIIAAALLAAFLIYLNWPSEPVSATRAPSATPVRTAVVQQQALPISVEALGTAIANESVTITAQQAEMVTKLAFDDGDIAQKGQLLVELDNREELARINELEVGLAEAKRQLARIKNLRKESAASEQLLDEQEARVQSFNAQIDVLQSQLSDLNIYAPFAGQLGIRQVSLGSLVQPGNPITTLDDISRMKIDFSVSETHLASLAVGQKMSARSVAYPDEVFEGQITTVGSRVDPVTRSIMVRGIIDNTQAKLRPGMLLQILLEKQVLQALVVPEKALVPNGDKQFVFVVNNNTVTQKSVEIGARRPGFVQIISGLNAGEEVIIDGTLRVRDKSMVRVLNASGE